MSKSYYVGHDDGRAVFVDPITHRRFVQDLDNHDDELLLFRTRKRKKAETECARANEVWTGFKVKRLKGGKKT